MNKSKNVIQARRLTQVGDTQKYVKTFIGNPERKRLIGEARCCLRWYNNNKTYRKKRGVFRILLLRKGCGARFL